MIRPPKQQQSPLENKEEQQQQQQQLQEQQEDGQARQQAATKGMMTPPKKTSPLTTEEGSESQKHTIISRRLGFPVGTGKSPLQHAYAMTEAARESSLAAMAAAEAERVIKHSPGTLSNSIARDLSQLRANQDYQQRLLSSVAEILSLSTDEGTGREAGV